MRRILIWLTMIILVAGIVTRCPCDKTDSVADKFSRSLTITICIDSRFKDKIQPDYYISLPSHELNTTERNININMKKVDHFESNRYRSKGCNVIIGISNGTANDTYSGRDQFRCPGQCNPVPIIFLNTFPGEDLKTLFARFVFHQLSANPSKIPLLII